MLVSLKRWVAFFNSTTMTKHKFLLFIVICTCSFLFGGCVSYHQLSYYDLETKLIGTELDGSYTVTAYGRARTAIDAYHQAQKQAVYDIVFKGASAQTSNLRTIQPVLLEVNAKDKYQSYFDSFFSDNGEYKKYCSMKDKKWQSSDFYRNNRQVVCRTTVIVYRSKLCEKLKQDNIIKTLE